MCFNICFTIYAYLKHDDDDEKDDEDNENNDDNDDVM
jgi:hypothetical protein